MSCEQVCSQAYLVNCNAFLTLKVTLLRFFFLVSLYSSLQDTPSEQLNVTVQAIAGIQLPEPGIAVAIF